MDHAGAGAPATQDKLMVPHAGKVMSDLETLFVECVDRHVQGLAPEGKAEAAAALNAMKFSVFTTAQRFVGSEEKPAPPVLRERLDTELATRVASMHSTVLASCTAPTAVEPAMEETASIKTKAAIVADEVKENAALLTTQAAHMEAEAAKASDSVSVAKMMLR